MAPGSDRIAAARARPACLALCHEAIVDGEPGLR